MKGKSAHSSLSFLILGGTLLGLLAGCDLLTPSEEDVFDMIFEYPKECLVSITLTSDSSFVGADSAIIKIRTARANPPLFYADWDYSDVQAVYLDQGTLNPLPKDPDLDGYYHDWLDYTPAADESLDVRVQFHDDYTFNIPLPGFDPPLISGIESDTLHGDTLHLQYSDQGSFGRLRVHARWEYEVYDPHKDQSKYFDLDPDTTLVWIMPEEIETVNLKMWTSAILESDTLVRETAYDTLYTAVINEVKYYRQAIMIRPE